MEEPATWPGNGLGGDEKLTLGLPLDDHQAVEADVVDKHPVGQVAARVFGAKGDPPAEVMPFGDHAGREGLARVNREVGNALPGLGSGCLAARLGDSDGQLRSRPELEVAQCAQLDCGRSSRFVWGNCRGDHPHGRVGFVAGICRIRCC